MTHLQSDGIEPGMIEPRIIIIDEEMYLLMTLSSEHAAPLSLFLSYEQAESLMGTLTDFLIEADGYYAD